ncbi:MAG: aspartyl protease family protein [Thermoguttaceae bacterium]|jgi:predicted aspartyl protease
MLIDSGSDTTLLPKTLAEQLKLQGERQEVLVGFDGKASVAEVVNAEVVFQGRVFRGEFPLIDDSVGILGRNVLNRFSLTLDGPRLSWREGP